MGKLESSLREWVALGFINREQEKLILEHENRKPESAWILTGLLILGAVIIGIGVISLIASNWASIPDGAKLAADFVILVGLAFWAVTSWSNKPLQFEIALLSFMLFVLASIGLIAQVYNTGGELWQALMLWTGLTVGVAIAARHMFVPFLWTGAFLGSLSYMLTQSRFSNLVLGRHDEMIALLIPLLTASLFFATQIFSKESAASRALKAWVFMTGLIGLAVAEFDHFWSPSMRALQAMAPAYVLAAFIAAGIIVSHTYHRLQKTMLLGLLVTFVMAFHWPMFFAVGVSGLTILALSFAALFMASLGDRGLFQMFVVFIGIRFLILYFEVFKNLAYTGFGLIVSGGLVIGLAVLWNKYRVKLAIWAEGWAR